jgi:hypothetical protein
MMPGELQPLVNNQRIINSDGTPTEYFIRWAQERQIDIRNGITAEQAQELINEWAASRQIIAGFGLGGGGDLSADVTLVLDAELGDLNDVDLSTPPTNGQVIGWNATTEVWHPINQSGGGGGRTPPTLVQFNTLRNDGTIALSTAPTPGNLMVFVSGGAFGAFASGPYIPSNFTPVAQYNSNGNNAVWAAMRRVQPGDTGSYSISASDNQSCVLYEFSGASDCVPVKGWRIMQVGSTSPLFVPKGYGATRLVIVENDNADNMSATPATGLNIDYNVNFGGDNHKSIYFRLDDTFSVELIDLAISGGWNNPVYGVFDVLGV